MKDEHKSILTTRMQHTLLVVIGLLLCGVATGQKHSDVITFEQSDGECGYIDNCNQSFQYVVGDTVLVEELQQEYLRGNVWLVYEINGIVLGLSVTTVKNDYGNYYQVPIYISNYTNHKFNFNPSKITSLLTDKKGRTIALHTLTAYEYMKKVCNTQAAIAVLMGTAAGLSYIHSTLSYNAAAAYQAQMLTTYQWSTFGIGFNNERRIIDAGYLKLNTIHPGETLAGYVNVKRKKGKILDVYVEIDGITYHFPWAL